MEIKEKLKDFCCFEHSIGVEKLDFCLWDFLAPEKTLSLQSCTASDFLKLYFSDVAQIVFTVSSFFASPVINAVCGITRYIIFYLMNIPSDFTSDFCSWWSCKRTYGAFFSHAMPFTAFFPALRCSVA